jgi:hypothetical protein
VRINGERVVEGKLRPGDELQIGNFKYQVCGDLLGRSKDHSPVEEYKAVPPAEATDLPPDESEAAAEKDGSSER